MRDMHESFNGTESSMQASLQISDIEYHNFLKRIIGV